ncbi:YchJ family protein [Jatrophihabitans sp.]|uniref:YchJ family protein n=1 Tax=Jatrophihabitans sp. TaxID=1932789 RepID=UPI002BB8DFE8|nr:YchJ family metal-binding protein [Jatrophihabitans sp.]
MTSCPCGLGEPYESCCGRYHRGEANPPTALTLMRARYAAFACGEEQFLAATWHPSTRPAGPLLDPALDWTALHITGHTAGGWLDETGTVAFTARYQRAGVPGRVRENSRFVRLDGRWSYLGPA